MLISLSPSDCYCTGYFLSNVCKTTTGEFRVNLFNCSIGDQGCKYLVSGLLKHLDSPSMVATKLNINLGLNNIAVQGISNLCKLLQNDCVSILDLSGNKGVSNQGAVYISKELRSSTSLRQLHLQECSITPEGAGSIAEAIITNTSLEELDISGNLLWDKGIAYVSLALTVNCNLKTLLLAGCGMTNLGLWHLANALLQNSSLTRLDIWNADCDNDYLYPNFICDDGVAFLTECLKKNSVLSELNLPGDFKLSAATAQEAINERRRRSGLPLIKVKGKFSFSCLLYTSDAADE